MTSEQAPEFVYVIGSPGSRTVKLGRSRNPKRRLSQIQTMSPVPLALLAIHEGDHEAETYLHRAFAARRTHGEWFAFDDDPLEAVSLALLAHAEEKKRFEAAQVDPEIRLERLRELNQASAEYLQTRRDLEDLIREAREAGVPLTAIAKHSGFSREWVRKIADGKATKRSA
ncbi:GIY-YIG nuclease family protein [Streptomyces sp. NPDC096030]|uniref:GIY-YIG nuclease family protein n=1 Tax=Streptomyces sp. NPDC096030 TaxID=3155423 RepID=UPI00331A5DEA